jgi:hypothetical protein
LGVKIVAASTDQEEAAVATVNEMNPREIAVFVKDRL